MKTMRSSGSWLIAVMLASAYVLVPACATEPSPSDDSPASEAEADQSICLPCPQQPFQPTHGSQVAPCPVCGGACGDGFCDSASGENTSSCPQDCRITQPPPNRCGNGICDSGETTTSCPQDCQCPTSSLSAVDPLRLPPACP